MEIGATTRILDHGNFRASYSLQKAEDSLTGLELNNSPRHLGKMRLSVPLYKNYIIPGLGMQYRSSVKTLAGNKTHDQFVFDFTLLSKEWIKGLEISASIYNLFNSRIENPGAGEHLQDIIELNGRSFRIKATYRF
jgi:iron complex outermembrane receptor protein